MLRLEKSAHDPENTALKGPELENLCNDRVGRMVPVGVTYGYTTPGSRVKDIEFFTLGTCTE